MELVTDDPKATELGLIEGAIILPEKSRGLTDAVPEQTAWPSADETERRLGL
ncbi:MAG TPA: hypothetical protein VJ302_34250 [Blastocatellia bacterium]|nr:hypothetical protein [Blastocatellia bacterium]